MIFTDEIKEWLPWVIKIRFVIIIFVFAIDYAIHPVDQSRQHCFHPLSGRCGHSVVHPQPVLSDLQSTQPRLPFAGVPSDLFRHRHYHRHRPCDGRPGKQLFFALSGGDYPGEHSPDAGARVSGGGGKFRFHGGHDRAGLSSRHVPRTGKEIPGAAISWRQPPS